MLSIVVVGSLIVGALTLILITAGNAQVERLARRTRQATTPAAVRLVPPAG